MRNTKYSLHFSKTNLRSVGETEYTCEWMDGCNEEADADGQHKQAGREGLIEMPQSKFLNVFFLIIID